MLAFQSKQDDFPRNSRKSGFKKSAIQRNQHAPPNQQYNQQAGMRHTRHKQSKTIALHSPQKRAATHRCDKRKGLTAPIPRQRKPHHLKAPDRLFTPCFLPKKLPQKKCFPCNNFLPFSEVFRLKPRENRSVATVL